MELFVKRSITRADLVQFGEYMVGGTTRFWLGYGVFAFCYSFLHWHWFPAKVVADLFGWTANYLIQRYWAFANKAVSHHEARTLERYWIIAATNTAIDYGIVGGLNALGVTPYIGFFVSATFLTVWNYAWYRFWVFIAKDKKEG